MRRSVSTAEDTDHPVNTLEGNLKGAVSKPVPVFTFRKYREAKKCFTYPLNSYLKI